MVEPLPLWRNTLKSVQATDQLLWTSRLAQWAAARTTMKLTLSNIIGPVTYTFNMSQFDMLLKTCLTTEVKMVAAAQISNAWAASAMASPMIVLPGCSLGAPTPATTWSAVVAIIDPPSVMMAKMQLMQGLMQADAVEDGYLSKMAEAFRQAFLTLSFTLTGMNCLPIPTPLVSPFTKTA